MVFILLMIAFFVAVWYICKEKEKVKDIISETKENIVEKIVEKKQSLFDKLDEL